jgi:hypothetical protein
MSGHNEDKEKNPYTQKQKLNPTESNWTESNNSYYTLRPHLDRENSSEVHKKNLNFNYIGPRLSTQ